MRARIWAEQQGIALIAPGERGDLDPSVDFGRLACRVPAFVLRPSTIDQVCACLRWLSEQRVPFKLRGSAHTASGEVLSDGGAVVALDRLAGIVADNGEEVTALGGTTWLALWEHLAASGRQPLALTDNPRTTLAGTLAVGGVGSASHLHGPQVAGVRRLVLVTPDGERRAVGPGDPYFAHALCGHGQLGAIAEVTIATWRCPSVITGRVLSWGTLDAFLAAADEAIAHRRYAYLHGRAVWNEGMVRVWAACAHAGPGEVSARDTIAASAVESFDLLAHARIDPSERWASYNPCVEVVLPYPTGADALRRIDTAVARGPLVRYLPRGSSLAVVPGTRDLPLSPFRADRNIVLALRPEPPTHAEALACEPHLRAIADEALAAGGTVYLASFTLAADALARQLGDGARTLAPLKAAVDPHALCDRGNLFGWEPA